MLMATPLLQVSQELFQRGIQRLYEQYRVYAIHTRSAWMQAVDAAAVRQVQVLAASVWHQQVSWWLALDSSSTSTIFLCIRNTLKASKKCVAKHLHDHYEHLCKFTHAPALLALLLSASTWLFVRCGALFSLHSPHCWHPCAF